MVIAYASRSLHLSQRRYCTTCREMLVAVVMCTHFVSSAGSVHPSYRSQFSPVAAEVSQWRWDVGSLVHVVGPVLGYF